MGTDKIELNPEEVLGQVSKIATTMAEVSAPGPVPPVALGISPIDAALNTVALAAAKQAGESSTNLAARGTAHNATSLTAVASLQMQEEKNTGKIAEIQSQVPQSGLMQA